jgi:hypothetical protein
MLCEAMPNKNIKDGWLAVETKKAKEELQAYIWHKDKKEAAIVKADDALQEPIEALMMLPAWYRWSTTKNAYALSPSEHARLPKAILADKDLPRVPKWKRHVNDVARFVASKKFGTHAAAFLKDVIFWHHQSTDGRWNEKIGRWDRYGVRSLAEWRSPSSLVNPDHVMAPRTFIRCKDRLVELGLIEAGSHLAGGKTKLWVKPTERLQRIIFDPGFWDTVKADFKTPPVSASKTKSKLKPRGLSARHAEIEAESMDLYKKAIAEEFEPLSDDKKWAIWHRLTKPVPLCPGRTKKPFTTKGESRYKLLHERLVHWI